MARNAAVDEPHPVVGSTGDAVSSNPPNPTQPNPKGHLLSNQKLILAASLVSLAGAAQAQSNVTIYGRIDLSVAQQADAVSNKEVRNGSSSRLGVRGVEDLGGGLRAVFQLEHRFNADDGTNLTERFWEGKSIVGLEGGFGRITLGREENPAYTFSQVLADPWATDTVANNSTIINGRIGRTRYNSSANYRFTGEGMAFGAQVAEAESNAPTGSVGVKRPYSLGGSYAQGAWRVGVGYENPPEREDHWATVSASYDFGVLRVGGFYGSGKNAAAQKVEATLVSLVAPLGGGQLRGSYGQLKNKDVPVDGVLDKQFGLGYHYPLSRRTTVYADLVNERRDNLPDGRRKTGYDLGLRHDF
jgi:predicted porin